MGIQPAHPDPGLRDPELLPERVCAPHCFFEAIAIECLRDIAQWEVPSREHNPQFSADEGHRRLTAPGIGKKLRLPGKFKSTSL